MLRPVKIAAFGDVHNCHNTTPTEKIAEEIRACFPYGKWAAGLDILVLDGDWFDKLMPNNHPDVYAAERSMYYLLRFCKDHDITFLVVDGTPLHDAGQIQKFNHINQESNINADLILVDDIDIVYLSKYDMNVLFIPDRPRTTPAETYSIVLDKMKEKSLEMIDMAVMHGCFQYQMPEIAQDHKHNEQEYEAIVRGPIIIGHIHRHSCKGNIIAPGSFSRLSHGEEEPKGFIELVLQPSGAFRAVFKENIMATHYKTINVTNLSLKDSYEHIRKNIENLPKGSRVRIECEANHPISLDKTFFVLKLEYLHLLWSIKVKVNKDVIADEKEVFSVEQDYVPLIINENNIKDLILERLSQLDIDSETLVEAPKYLIELLSEANN